MFKSIIQQHSPPFSYTKKFPGGTSVKDIHAFGEVAKLLAKRANVTAAVELLCTEVVIKTGGMEDLKRLMFHLEPSVLDPRFKGANISLAYTNIFSQKGTMPVKDYEHFMWEWIKAIRHVGEQAEINLSVDVYGDSVAVIRVENYRALEKLRDGIEHAKIDETILQRMAHNPDGPSLAGMQ
ncbi:MAG: hypothetical protein KA155_02800 [Alphaproteobacteria bacterium]|jgi:hypothetical protein|nr:hypothetical protein [Alphaproteobacteria bacterium]